MTKNTKYKEVLYCATESLLDDVEWCPCGSTEKEALEKYLEQNADKDVVFIYKLCAVYKRPKKGYIREEVL